MERNKRLIIEVSSDTKKKIMEESLKHDLKIKGFLMGLFYTYIELDEDKRSYIKREIINKNKKIF